MSLNKRHFIKNVTFITDRLMEALNKLDLAPAIPCYHYGRKTADKEIALLSRLRTVQ